MCIYIYIIYIYRLYTEYIQNIYIYIYIIQNRLDIETSAPNPHRSWEAVRKRVASHSDAAQAAAAAKAQWSAMRDDPRATKVELKGSGFSIGILATIVGLLMVINY